MAFERYAIYWAPEPGSALAEFGRRWFGSDPDTGPPPDERALFGLDAGLAGRAVESPRRYGLHATVKAPFRPAMGIDEAALARALDEFCARRRRVRSAPLRLHRFTRYLALVPEGRRAGIEWLADECVTHFDRFRAPLSEADLARRSGSLSPLERAHFEEFGYPHIFSLFFFHITLAGPLAEEELAKVEAALAPAVAPFTAHDFELEGFAIFGDPGGGESFRALHRSRLMR
jgi:hypothetical protein